jgi:cytosine/adenosine deaminase-related metal-dependent hydrolase
VLRLTARWLLPVVAPPLADGALLVDAEGRIAAVGSDAEVPRPEGARTIDLGEAALLPGLVNAHAHPDLTAFRGLLEDLTFPDWIDALLRVRRTSQPLFHEYEAAAAWTCVEAIAAGVTTLAATEDSGASLSALRGAGLRGIVFREVFGPDPAQADDALAGLCERVAAMQRDAGDLVRVGVSPHAPYSVSDRLFRGVVRYAIDEGLRMAVHIAESADETLFVTAATGEFANRLRARGIAVVPRGHSPIELLARTGVLEAAPLLIHCVRIDGHDVRRIAEAGATVVHCPAANARLGHGIAPLTELLEAGVSVGLGSDSVASNNRIDILEEARLAQLFQRARTGAAAALPARTLLELATLSGARALGLDDRIGSLEVGKDADLCAVAMTAPHVRPVNDVLAALLQAARASDVILTMVRGRILHGAGIDVRAGTRGLGETVDRFAARVRGDGGGTDTGFGA